MTRLPVIPTIIVAAAVAVMVALGVWQLARKDEKEALIALYRTNLERPEIAFPRTAPVRPDELFRRSSATCLSISGLRLEGGRSATGATGYRRIASCRIGAEGPGLLVDMGVSADPGLPFEWSGGPVSGWITTEPTHESMVAALFGRAAIPRPLLVSDKPAPGLTASERPDPADIPNNHLAYAVQWFLFAGIAGVIYWLAVKRRQKTKS
jgi:cytochrome oxidase assembly protein ShyY1